MSNPLPPHVRPIVFAGTELLLDLIYLLQSYHKLDLESLLILHCINDATMRPFMVDPSLSRDLLTIERPPEEIRGSISRRMIADKTGLPRETVRRKTNELVANGAVVVDAEDRLRIGQALFKPELQHMVEEAHQIMVRYITRLQTLGVDWQNVPLPNAQP